MVSMVDLKFTREEEEENRNSRRVSGGKLRSSLARRFVFLWYVTWRLDLVI